MAASNQTSSQAMENTINGTSNSSSSQVSNSSNQIQSENKWIFSQEDIENSPSRKDGLSAEQELAKRQEAALFISDLGEELKVNQLCINTAIIYMHRFFMLNSFKKFHRYVRVSLLFKVKFIFIFFSNNLNYQDGRGLVSFSCMQNRRASKTFGRFNKQHSTLIQKVKWISRPNERGKLFFLS